MEVIHAIPREPFAHQLQCAQQVLDILFRHTALSTITRNPPKVIVGGGNWIGFTVDRPLSSAEVLGLPDSSGARAFLPDIFSSHRRARSRTSPSLHLTNLDSGEVLCGHVDAYYWARNPYGHAVEFLLKKTIPPSALLQRLLD